MVMLVVKTMNYQEPDIFITTIFPRILAASTINFCSEEVPRLFEGGVCFNSMQCAQQTALYLRGATPLSS